MPEYYLMMADHPTANSSHKFSNSKLSKSSDYAQVHIFQVGNLASSFLQLSGRVYASHLLTRILAPIGYLSAPIGRSAHTMDTSLSRPG